MFQERNLILLTTCYRRFWSSRRDKSICRTYSNQSSDNGYAVERDTRTSGERCSDLKVENGDLSTGKEEEKE